jgi:hypothetical protein
VSTQHSSGMGYQPMFPINRHGLVAHATWLLMLLCTSCAAQELADHDGYRGVWVKSETLEAFVATQPKFRILSIRKPGQPSLVADGRIDEPGLRLAFMATQQVKTSFDPGLTPAEQVEPGTFRLKPADGLQYTVTVKPDRDKPRLTLTYELQNVGQVERPLACWSVLSYPCDGTIVLATGQQRRARRRVVMSWWTRWPIPGLQFGRDAMSLDTAAAKEPGVAKIGVITDTGWVAFVRGGDALVSTVAFDATATYPEDGPNITVFQTVGEKMSRAETEQVGPLKAVPPGGTIRMSETLDLLSVPATVPLPKEWAAGAAGETDALRKRVEAVLLPSTRPAR